MNKKIILIGLNELNFEFIQYYISQGKLKNLKKILSEYGYTETISENTYDLWEPWIQWVTIHTGKTYDEHKIFRLGDIKQHMQLKQLWEIAEQKGLTVGAVSPFNADNRLSNARFFVSDPWTNTHNDGSWLIKKVATAVSQAVNDNAQSKLTLSSIGFILLAFLRYPSFKKYSGYLRHLKRLRSHKGTKAVILDKLLGDVFIHNWKKHKPDFSSLFLNTGAHFQHHYMFNSAAYKGNFINPDWYCPKEQDPLLNILQEYDDILGDIADTGAQLFIATGLHQKPHKHLTFYWRLKNHAEFLNQLSIPYKSVMPRMSRDFLIEFSTPQEAANAEKALSSVVSVVDSIPIFQIDNRGASLFIELVYPHDIKDGMSVKSVLLDKQIENFKEHVAFVAIKNGEHDGIGYFIDSNNKVNPASGAQIHLKETFNIIVESFNKLTK